MKIVIPMAGFGTRLRPHTWSKPKPLVSTAGKPVLGHVLDMFSSISNVDELIAIVGYLGDQIEDYIHAAYPQWKARFVTQEEMLGQSHAIWLAREGLEGPMVLAFVDTVIDADLSILENEAADAVAWVKEVEDPRRFGVVELKDDGFVKEIIEKPSDPSNNLALVGFYYFKEAKKLIDAIEKQMDAGTQLGGEFYLADAVNIMLDEGLKMRVEEVNIWKDCGKPGPLLETNRYLLDTGRDNTQDALQRDGAVIIPPVYIAPTAAVSESVIGPYVSIGPECVIQQSVIRDSIVEEGSRIESSHLEKSIIGRNASVVGRYQQLNVGDESTINSPE
ncbi:MAG: sugar phosphate nucleotidyltransferase [Anaerolineales bacterium]|jgi:glucose-1-phosphate thymidylyltransferase